MSDALFIFRRDLRVNDNTGLLYAAKNFRKILPCFIIDPRQFEEPPFLSLNARDFLIESLEDLNLQLKNISGKLFIFKGESEDIFLKICKKYQLNNVVFNKDYTPFSLKRDLKIQEIAKENSIQTFLFDDELLVPPNRAKKASGDPYTIFTPFYKMLSKQNIAEPDEFTSGSFFTQDITEETNLTELKKFISKSSDKLYLGGRQNALKKLSEISKITDYSLGRDYPSLLGTTLLSPHHKFGTCSVRETYFAIKKLFGENHQLIMELFWRDFFTNIAYNFPHVFKGAFNKKFANVAWRSDEKFLERWKSGTTGFPIVDAGMKELNETGFMHNRVRMIVASFLTKDLQISWQEGERYFANKLVDYDPAVNNGNWQWAASTGCDAQPYFRIFNPWLQQKKFDADCIYIKKWVPELEKLPAKEIHRIGDTNKSPVTSYPDPIVNHAEARKMTEKMFDDALNN